jgi:peptidylprolyl isomerase
MKQTVLALILAAGATAAYAQTAPKPAAPAAVAHHAAPVSSAMKLPPGVPPVRGIVKTAFTLRYEDIKIGTGADAEPNKQYKVFYTGYLGNNGRPDDGHKFDSSQDHPGPPIRDKDGKPVMGDDGKPKLGDPMPMAFPQGMGKLIPGFDQGFYGMKIGGKRRIFIPWQLAYGARGRPGPDAEHPGIPPKADLIFDVELVDVADLAMPPNHPGMGQMPGGRPMPGMNPNNRRGMPPTPGKPVTVPAPSTSGAAPATPGTVPAPATPPTTPPPSTTPTPPTPPTQAQPQQQ